MIFFKYAGPYIPDVGLYWWLCGAALSLNREETILMRLPCVFYGLYVPFQEFLLTLSFMLYTEANNRDIVLMQENFNTQSMEIRENISLDSLIRAYNQLLSGVRVRTYNVLTAWQQSFPDYKQFFEHLFASPHLEIMKLRNCGRLTFKEIIALREQLADQLSIPVPIGDSTEPDPEPEEKKEKISMPANIDEILPLFLSTINGLSTRSANRVHWLLKECNNSLTAFYERISDPDCIKDIPTVGRKSIPELQDFFARSILFLRQFPDEESVSAHVKHHLIASPAVLGLPDDALDSLREKEDTLGYFPVFAALQLYFENLPEEEKALIDGCLLIHQDQELPEREEVAASLKLTPERVRQKRNKLIETLPDYFKTYYNLGFITENPYRYQMNHVEDDVNVAEGTDFNLNFVSWVLGSIFDGLTLIGDPVKSIGGYFDTDQYLCLVPAALTGLFDFDGFIQDLDERMAEKRMGEEKVNLKSLINAHLKVQYCEDKLPDIETICRTILYLHFTVEVDLGYVIFPSNCYKTNTFIVEGILREAGRPMAFDEIKEEYQYQYPERDTTESSLRGAITANRNIVPIGRSSTYALKEWHHSEMRGGTIREFVSEYLDALDDPVAPAEDVCEYVMQFRPNTNESSISSNLMQEKNHKFLVLFKDGVRYYGYSDYEYGDEYKVIGGNRKMKRPTQESMRLLEDFILRNRRYPVRNLDDDEEYRLYRFIGNRRSACSRGVVQQEEIDEWLAFEDKYCEYDIAPKRKRKTQQ